jgi:hypothetical protein
MADASALVISSRILLGIGVGTLPVVRSVTGSRPGQNLGFRRSANPLLALAT